MKILLNHEMHETSKGDRPVVPTAFAPLREKQFLYMPQKLSSGFTLIELMVVLAIAALGVSLVTPNMIRSYESFKVSAEERKLVELLASVRMKAFLRNSAYVIQLKDNIFILANKDVQVYFNYIEFPTQKITINEHGFWDVPRISYQLSNQSGMKTIESLPDAS